MTTIKDVAAAAGVSPSTASRALNDKGSISPKVRAKVKRIAAEMNYLPNEMARSLQTRRTHMIGLVAHQADSSFYGRLIQSIERRCFENGYKLLLCTTGGSAIRENTFAKMFDANKLDGAILADMIDDPSVFSAVKMPVVTVERYLSDSIPMVTCDKEAAGRLAARTLWDRGCRTVGYFVHEFSKDVAVGGRIQAFLAESERLGLTCVQLRLPLRDVFLEEYPSYFRRWFEEHPAIDGFFGSDELAVLCWEACRVLGYRVPEQVQILGFDGLDISRQFRVSTIAQPIEEMGALAFDMLLRLMQGEIVASRSVLPVRLIERETTKTISD